MFIDDADKTMKDEEKSFGVKEITKVILFFTSDSWIFKTLNDQTWNRNDDLGSRWKSRLKSWQVWIWTYVQKMYFW